jgi:uncharacterized protein (TIGR02597 family)
MINRIFLLSLAIGFATNCFVKAEDSDICGFIQLSAQASTDTHISPAFSRPCVWRDRITSITSNTFSIGGSPNWSANAFVPSVNQTDTYYVKILSGALNGLFFTITGNDATSVTIDNAGVDLSTLAPGDQIEIAPYWTLGTLYPASEAGTKFIASSSPLARQTEIMPYDASSTGINRTPSNGYFFYNGAWRKIGSNIAISFDNTVLYPDSYFLQRNKANATSPLFLGRVNTASISTILEGAPSTQNDNYTALSFPLDVTLNRSGLASSGFSSSPSPGSITDRLLLFDPSLTGYNIAPSATYYYYNNAWRKVGSSASIDFGNSVNLPAGGGFIIRKATGASSAIWQFNTQL